MSEKVTNVDMLEQVDNAIINVLAGGQTVKLGSKLVTRADLGALYKIKNDLSIKAATEDSNSLLQNTYVAFFEGR